MSVIVVSDLTQHFGPIVAVDQLSFTVPQGSIFGLVGPNGAGKTTVLRSISTLLAPSAGEIEVLGRSVRRSPASIRRQIGYMPDEFGVYGELRVWEYLDFYGRLYGMQTAARNAAIRDMLELLDISTLRDRYVQHLSRGTAQRIALARCLLHDPSLLILDEPASGLDPRARSELRALLAELQALGKTIVLSSHILADIAEVCTHVGIIDQGRRAVEGSLDDVLQQAQGARGLVIELLNQTAELTQQLSLFPELLNIEVKMTSLRTIVRCRVNLTDVEINNLLVRLVNTGLPLVSFREESLGLERIFLQVTCPEDR